MALHVDVDTLIREELVFELRSRGLDVKEDDSVDDLKRQFRAIKGAPHDLTKVNTYLSTLSIDNEFQVCEEKLNAVLQADHSSSSCRRRCLSKLSHIILRLEKLHYGSAEQQLKKIALVSNAYSALQSLRCNNTPGPSNQAEVQCQISEAPSVVSCQAHASQVLKWNLLFDGRTSVHDFILRLEELKYSSGVSDVELLRNAVHLFSGEALLWFRTNKHHLASFEDLVSSLRTEFQPVEYERCLLNQIRARLQGSDENIKSYINIMEGLFMRLSTPVSQVEQLDIIMTNMSPFFISKLALLEVNSIKQLKEICARLQISRFKCDNRGFLNTGRECILPDFYGGSEGPMSTTPGISPRQVNSMPSRNNVVCSKCGGMHHNTQCNMYRTPICLRCKRPGVLTRDCNCSKN